MGDDDRAFAGIRMFTLAVEPHRRVTDIDDLVAIQRHADLGQLAALVLDEVSQAKGVLVGTRYEQCAGRAAEIDLHIDTQENHVFLGHYLFLDYVN